MVTAHYYASKVTKFVIFGTNGKFTNESEKVDVSGKREANKIAKERNATPWNF